MAERLGKTVGEIENTMSSRELVEWGAYDSILAIKREHAEMHARATAKARG